jgi:hypothetical protein
LQALETWIERGGRVVVTPSSRRDIVSPPAGTADDEPEFDILEALEVDDAVQVGELSEDYVEIDYTAESSDSRGGSDTDAEPDDSRWQMWGAAPEPVPPATLPAAMDGSLRSLAEGVRRLALPGDGYATLRAKSDDLDGSLHTVEKDGNRHLLVAVVKRGAGEVVVVAEPALLGNRLLAEADNSVLAARLIAPRRHEVVFDEFYHGLAVRGNPLYLLTRPGFAAATVGLLLVVGTITWRVAVFLGPPLTKPRPSRRDIGEYVNAMSQFFSRGRGSRRFLVSEVRDGVLRQVCHELKLPMDTINVERITQALARRDRQRARRLDDVVRDIDAALARPGDYPRESFLPVIQRLASCL